MLRYPGPGTALGLTASVLLFGVSVPAMATHEPASNFYGVRIAPMGSSQAEHVMCSDGEGGAIVAFTAYIGSSSNLYVQRVNSLGAPLWAASGVPVCTTPEDQRAPSICSDGAGGAFLFWSDTRGGGDVHTDIYAQRINASGQALWLAEGVPIVVGVNSQGDSRVIPDGAGGAIVTWCDTAPNSAELRVHAQRVNAAGARLWGANGVLLCDPPGQGGPAIVSDGSGGAIIAWTDLRGHALYGQHVTPQGDRTWGADGTRLSFTPGSTREPVLLEDGSGGAFLTWYEYVLEAVDYDAYVQRVDAAGDLPWGTSGHPLSTSPGNQSGGRLVTDGVGGAFVVWQDLRSATSTDLYIQRFDAAGNRLWEEGGMELCVGPGTTRDPRIVADAGGGVIVAWWDDRTAGVNHVYAQGVGPTGTLRWASNGVALCTARYGQGGPELVPAPDGSAVVAWSDNRSGSYANIYALQTPQGPVDVHDDEDPETLSLAPLGPNPSRGGLHVAFTLPTAGAVHLSLHDVAGRRVRTIYDGSKDEGPHQQYVDLSSGPGPRLVSGVYLVRLEAGGLVRTGRFVFLP